MSEKGDIRMTFKIRAEDEELLNGAIDLHVHASPSLFERMFDELELARQARDIGYRAILFKCHYVVNADRMQLIRKVLPGIEVFGGVVLNYPVGGLNPEAVDAAIRFGAKEVWMPTIHAAHHIQVEGAPTYPHMKAIKELKRRPKELKGISILTREGEVLEEVYEILEMIADADIVLGTSHLSLEEIYALIEAAKSTGVKKILVTHPELEDTLWPIEDQIKMADMGAIIEHCFNTCMPGENRSAPHARGAEFVSKAIKEVGANRCVMSSDLGQPYNTHPIEGFRQFMRLMIHFGIGKREIDIMTKVNPSKLLGLS